MREMHHGIGDEYDEPVFVFPDDDDSGYEAPPAIFPDDDDRYEDQPIALLDDEDDIYAAPSVSKPPSVSSEYGISFADEAPASRSGDTIELSSAVTRMQRGSGRGPVEYPEDSFGSFSTPEDYSSHKKADNKKSRTDNIPEPSVDYDGSILIFPDIADDDTPAPVETKSTQKTTRAKSSSFAQPSEGDIDDSVGISFSKYSPDAKDKESEYFFMPFLDIPDDPDDDEDDDDDEGTSFSLSFKKVNAEEHKKEKEFVFMPFLNISDDPDDDEDDDGDESRKRQRSMTGAIFDEGLYLIPLESEEEEEEDSEEEEEDDSGIYVVGDTGGVVPTVPKNPRPATLGSAKSKSKSGGSSAGSGKNKSTKKPSSGGKKSSGGSSKSSSKSSSTSSSSNGKKKMSHDEQFRAAMRNIDPEIRAAVKNDPIQRAALEQAVRIALVQKAAQEAVAKATGQLPFDLNSMMGGQRQGKSGKKRPPKPPQKKGFGSNASGGLSFSPISLSTQSGYSSTPSEFGVGSSSSGTPSEFGISGRSIPTLNMSGLTGVNSPENTPTDNNTPKTEPAAPQNTDNQDPALASRNTEAVKKTSGFQSPAAVRAAMRSGGLDFMSTQLAAASVAPSAKENAAAALAEESQAKRSGCLIWIIVVFIVFFIGIIAIAVWPSLNREVKYQQGVTELSAGNYMEAAEIFESLDTYKDSETKRVDSICEQAQKYMESGDYHSAADILEDVKSANDNAASLNAQCHFILGQQYFAEGKYLEAYNEVWDITRYSDEVKELALAANYECAMQYYLEEDYANAAALFGKYPEYKDSQSQWNTCEYAVASQYADAGKYADAYKIYVQLGDYGQSKLYAAQMLYHSIINGQTNFSVSDFSTLTDSLDVLERNKNSQEVRNIIADPLYNPIKLIGNWNDGVNYLIFSADDNGSSMTLYIADYSNNALNVSGLTFDSDNGVYNGQDGTPYITILNFDDPYTADPDSFTFYCHLNGNQYTFNRVR